MKTIGAKHTGTENRKKEIVKAALSCFIQTGTAAASIQDICKKAKASTGSIYHHFGSKEQLAAAVYLEGIADYQAGFISSLETSEDAESGIYGVIAYHLAWVEGNPDWARFIVRERHSPFMGDTEGELARLNGEFMSRVSHWFRRHIEAGSIKRLSPGLYQAILMGPVQEFVKNHMLGDKKPDVTRISKELGFSAWISLKT